jgi:hypothetical protein
VMAIVDMALPRLPAPTRGGVALADDACGRDEDGEVRRAA